MQTKHFGGEHVRKAAFTPNNTETLLKPLIMSYQKCPDAKTNYTNFSLIAQEVILFAVGETFDKKHLLQSTLTMFK